MFKIVCVTDRKSCREDFFARIEKIAAAKPDRILYRDKNVSIEEYCQTALKIADICRKYGVSFSKYRISEANGDTHFTMNDLRELKSEIPANSSVSVHSVEEAVEAESKGICRITAGHIFQTACKADSAPRGPEFLKNVCEAVNIPVYAIGGINPQNINLVKQAGADGACIMSGLMACENPAEYIKELRRAADEG